MTNGMSAVEKNRVNNLSIEGKFMKIFLAVSLAYTLKDKI